MIKINYYAGDKVEITPEGFAEATADEWWYAVPLKLGKTYTVSGVHGTCLAIRVRGINGLRVTCGYHKKVFK